MVVNTDLVFPLKFLLSIDPFFCFSTVHLYSICVFMCVFISFPALRFLFSIWILMSIQVYFSHGLIAAFLTLEMVLVHSHLNEGAEIILHTMPCLCDTFSHRALAFALTHRSRSHKR